MQVQLKSDQLTAVIDSTGAELISLQKEGKELLWGAGPEWNRHAPVLFPVIGRVTDDVIHHEGRGYPIKQHGFARDSDFALVTSTPAFAHWRLNHAAAGETQFPFPCSLETEWSLDSEHLGLTFTLSNTGDEPLPAALGWHPAFRCPTGEGWKLLFEHDEPGPVRRVNSRVQLIPEWYGSPLSGNSLELNEELLGGGAVIFESLRSRKVQLVSPAGPVLTMAFPDFPHFAVWKKPGADFICLEPWSKLPQPDGERQEVLSMSSIDLLMPGSRKTYTCRMTPYA